jgi:DNA helicase HerA-like ATPase
MTEQGAGDGVVAVSLDGRQFHFDGRIGASVEPGEFVTLEPDGAAALIGQVDDVALSGPSTVHGAGRILGAISADGRLDARLGGPFATAPMLRAGADVVELVYDASRATLPVGSLLDSEIPARLMPHRFNRHTFWCGQSGSGKTYALGVLLERLLLDTELPMVILDPNSDFVHLSDAGAGRDADASAGDRDALAGRDIRVLRPRQEGPDGLRVSFIDMPTPAKAAVLRLDPVADRAEYNKLIHLEAMIGTQYVEDVVPALAQGDDVAKALSARIENLRLVDWDVWALGHRTATEIIDERPDATVLDLGGFGYPEEYLVVAMAVLDDLWAKRESRRPILIVIDEAHNLCAPDGDSPLQRAVRERIIQIAAEGRKFGLWLLLSTQRPSKIHPSIISQCDNLALMRMSSPIDLEELATVFGFAPPAMIARSPRFRQGEALFAGGFVPAPSMIKVGDRLTREGGVDVSVPLRKVAS